MFSSSPTFLAPPPFLSSSSPVSSPSRTFRFSSSLSATTSCVNDPQRLRQIPQRFSATTSLYDILEIPIGSSSKEIKSAYRRLARICHPDVTGNGRDSSSSAEDFMKIHAAYCTLSDPEKRAVYDRKNLLRRGRALNVGVCVSGLGSYGGRKWETDQCW